jgi:hypothetical protein
MQLTVNNNLNVRVGSASTDAPIYTYAKPGDIIDVEDAPVVGTMIDGNNIWYKYSGTNNFSWSGGTENGTDYSSVFNIPNEWKTLSGSDVIVAILDTGCFLSDSINSSIINSYNAIDKNADINDESDSGHGTFIAGIIAANLNNYVKGFAINCKLIIVKVSENDENGANADIVEGLRWLLNDCQQKPDIINISSSLNQDKNTVVINGYLDELFNNGAIIYGAAGNNDEIVSTPYYPASYKSVTAVATLRDDSLIIKNSLQINNKIKYIVPDVSYTSLRNDNFSPSKINSGCSFATAALSGFTALAMSYYKKNIISLSLTQYIDSYINKIDFSTFTNNYSINRLS